VIDQGSITELAKKYMPHEYELEVEDRMDLLVERLNNLDFVEEVLLEGTKIICRVKDPGRFCREVPKVISDLDLSLRRFQPSYGVLMEVYKRHVKGEENR